MALTIVWDLVSTQTTYLALLEILQYGYEKFAGDHLPMWNFVIRSGALGVIILTLYFLQDEDTELATGSGVGTIFVAALIFIFPAIFLYGWLLLFLLLAPAYY